MRVLVRQSRHGDRMCVACLPEVGRAAWPGVDSIRSGGAGAARRAGMG